MMKKAFVIGDIHGMIDHFEEMLTHWQMENEQLIFVGDYIDRGVDSRQTLLLVHELTMLNDAIALRGNHEEMLLDFLTEPERHWTQYYLNGGHTTVADLLNISQESIDSHEGQSYQEQILMDYPWLLPWLKSLPFYTEFGDFIIVHAGIDLSLSDWRQTAPETFVWTREEFLNTPNHTDKKIIFGHTPTMTLQPEGGVYQSNDGKYGIDGGAVYGMDLIALRMTTDKIEEIVTIPIHKGEN
ncbi:serine/threonine protein phosphatase [Aerococcaceae bacterium DSM 111020]|nr:serine/threonine protein phosphatase [Aerococcaceae bacterium DSM 111020]